MKCQVPALGYRSSRRVERSQGAGVVVRWSLRLNHITTCCVPVPVAEHTPLWRPRKKVAEIVAQMLRALAHCHLKGVVLCDVKPDNFLFDRKGEGGVLRAIDLGLSRRFTPGQALRRAAGTAFFVAPEVGLRLISAVLTVSWFCLHLSHTPLCLSAGAAV